MTLPLKTIQRNWIIEHEDELVIGGSEAMQTIADRLPAKDTLSVADIAAALDCHRSVVYAWIDAGKFRSLDKSGGDKPHYSIFRNSFLEFLKSRIK